MTPKRLVKESSRLISLILLFVFPVMSGICATKAQAPKSDLAFANDPGVDYCIVNSKTILLEAAFSKGEGLLTLMPGSKLILTSRVESDKCYDAIDFATGREGYIKAASVKVILTAHPKPHAPLSTVQKPEAGTAIIDFENNSNSEARVRLGSHVTVVPAHSKVSVTVPGGTYSYYIAEPYVIPEFGTRTFDTDEEYTWAVAENVKTN